MKEPPTQKQIDAVLNWCDEAEDEGRSHYPGMTYEQGVAAAIRWLREGWDSPMED